ncbi:MULTISPECIES: acyl-CoA dehydrogenase family protein [Shouchella]|uniref:Acyl-CoA/acyl-ACP dehydrogenase n=2 Tax=Shouchella TaxID=2893057 RepID=A0ABY7VZJ7_9BACI|nr:MULTISPECIES: acyl-CoA dehydrogenase family protein [Shouchella]MED4129751.1 acyl-CoA/acyl-ACP dehydrogenase [Shouchella miscanthi]WDF02087.1 acyl-CoA/acyl-ACP dehydrogenase [Shouchella hunanensis]
MSLFLEKERQVFRQYFPTIDEAFGKDSLWDREKHTDELLQQAKESGMTALMIPKEYGGKGATALDAIYIQRWIASKSPSLAVSLMMHQFSVASLIEAATIQPNLQEVLKQIAENNLLLASAFAEGVENTLFTPTVQAKGVDGGIVVNGTKKPCTNSRTMDLLTASVGLPNGDLAVITIPSNTDGIHVNDFWEHWILKGTHTEEVVLKDVFVPNACIYRAGPPESVDSTITNGLLWFELFMIATYIGVTSTLVEKVNKANRVPLDRLFELMAELEGAMTSLEGIAFKFESKQYEESILQETLFARHAIDKTLERLSTKAAKMLGGLNYLTSKETSYLLLVNQLISFHPPSKTETLQMFELYARGIEQEVTVQ